MINKNMEAAGSWHTSTPLQCRHDSGYEGYSKYCALLELSPIRKQSDLHQAGNKKYLGISDKVNPRKLNFFSLCYGNSSDSSANDSGIASIIESVAEKDSQTNKTSECLTDENSNFICPINTTENQLNQPSKYICKDHSHEKCKTSNKCNRKNDVSKIFSSYAISSDLFTSAKNSSRLDILYELSIRNCSSIISDILSYLSNEDLRQANNVSKSWQDIVSSDKNANIRRRQYIKNKKNAACGPNKENNTKLAPRVEKDHKSAFMSLSNIEYDTKQPLSMKSIQGRFNSFIQELKGEGDQQTIMKCPKCRYPGRADTELKYCCTRNLCKYEFCRKCLGPFLDNHKCLAQELNNSLPSIVVGSKKSRKNLRRLKA